VQHGLHRAAGKAALTWKRGSEVRSGQLELAEGWKKTNITGRPSLLDILPSLTVYKAKRAGPAGASPSR
jgi:hypothetical protein